MRDAMDDEPSRSRRRARVGLVLLAIVAIALAGLWLVRKPLATRYADQFLAGKHVRARYRVVDLGLGRQRLADVVIGDPAHPDLVADWLEARTAIGLSGPYLTGVRGGQVRVRARVADGRLSLGSIDRLLPTGEPGKPFALPALALDVEDLRAHVETRWGVIGAKLVGQGRLDGGFTGRLAVTSDRLAAGCVATGPRLAMRVTTWGDAVRLEGSGEMAGAACAGVTIGYANVNGTGEIGLGRALRWTVTTDLAAQAVRHRVAAAARLAGRVTLAGGSAGLRGDVDLAAHDVAGQGARASMVTLSGAVLRRPAPAGLGFDGRVGWTHGQADVGRLGRLADAGAGTPLDPLVRRLVAGLARAARDVGGDLRLAAETGATGARVTISGASVTAASGARAALAAGGGIAWTAASGPRLTGQVGFGGGGLPDGGASFEPGGPGTVRGVATVRPYAADGARLALTPVHFAYARDGWHIATQAKVSGPLGGDGQVEALTLPVDAVGRGGGVTLAGGCTPVSWRRIAVAGLVLDPASVRLCGRDGALVTITGGRVGGGATLGDTRLTGRLGGTPLTVAASGATVALAARRFVLTGVAARLGRPDRITTLTAATLDGAFGAGGVGGRFAGAGGRIGAVPLVMSDAAGSWRFAGGELSVDGGLTVGDAQADHPRFRPLPVRAIALTLRGNAITATGSLRSPDAGRMVATIRLTHDLAAGTGAARFTVPGLVFDKALQPDQLTPVTFGVVADVRGTVTGEGAIDWSPAGVTSTGRFATEGTDLAAAFGPVQGIAGTIRFTDLLALESAPGQTFRVREVNPGIAVTDGTVTLQTLPNARVAVAGARWPFAGGTLTLEPTLLDFGAAARRRMVFRVDGVAADQFLQQFDFKNLDATGIFDGVLPIMFDADGGRIEDGHLTVRAGGGTIAYVGAIGQKDVGFWGNLAFQALKSLRYRSLAVQMNGPLAGEMVTEVRFAGISQGEGAATGGIAGLLVGRLQRLPFIFNIRIRAPFRGLLDATASFYDPRRLIQRNLPQLIEEQNRAARAPAGTTPPPQPIQPPASETVP